MDTAGEGAKANLSDKKLPNSVESLNGVHCNAGNCVARNYMCRTDTYVAGSEPLLHDERGNPRDIRQLWFFGGEQGGSLGENRPEIPSILTVIVFGAYARR